MGMKMTLALAGGGLAVLIAASRWLVGLPRQGNGPTAIYPISAPKPLGTISLPHLSLSGMPPVRNLFGGERVPSFGVRIDTFSEGTEMLLPPEFVIGETSASVPLPFFDIAPSRPSVPF